YGISCHPKLLWILALRMETVSSSMPRTFPLRIGPEFRPKSGITPIPRKTIRVYFSSCSVGPRPSERPSDKERRRSDITENIVEGGRAREGSDHRRSITALQPAEARMDYWNRL